MKCDHRLKDIGHFIWTKCFITAYFIDIVLNLYNDILNWLRYLYPNPSKLEGGILESTCLSVHLSGCLSVHLCRQHGFQSINEVCFWNFNFKFHVLVDCGHRQKPIDFQQCHFQNGCLAILDCLVSGLDCLVTILDFLVSGLQFSVAQYLRIWEIQEISSYFFLRKWIFPVDTSLCLAHGLLCSQMARLSLGSLLLSTKAGDGLGYLRQVK